MRRFSSLTSALIVCGLLASSAWAKDICVVGRFGKYLKFTGVKSLSQPGKVSPLHGTYGVGEYNAPVSGTAIRTSTGVHIGVFVHSMAPFVGNDLSATFVTDTNFNGSGFYDNAGDHAADGSWSLTNVNCNTLPPLLMSGPGDDPTNR